MGNNKSKPLEVTSDNEESQELEQVPEEEGGNEKMITKGIGFSDKRGEQGKSSSQSDNKLTTNEPAGFQATTIQVSETRVLFVVVFSSVCFCISAPKRHSK